MARMKLVWDQGIPAYLKGLERIDEARACDVSCSPNTFQGCVFGVSTISICSMFTGLFPVLIYISWQFGYC